MVMLVRGRFDYRVSSELWSRTARRHSDCRASFRVAH